MKIVKFVLIFAMAIFVISCSTENESETPKTDISESTITPSVLHAPEKPFANPVLIYGSSFGEYFQMLYKTGQFEQMLKFTSSGTLDKFGNDAVLGFYKKVDFAYHIKLKSKNEHNGITTLNYEAGIMATRNVLRMDVVVENDTCKLILKDLKGIK